MTELTLILGSGFAFGLIGILMPRQMSNFKSFCENRLTSWRMCSLIVCCLVAMGLYAVTVRIFGQWAPVQLVEAVTSIASCAYAVLTVNVYDKLCKHLDHLPLSRTVMHERCTTDPGLPSFFDETIVCLGLLFTRRVRSRVWEPATEEIKEDFDAKLRETSHLLWRAVIYVILMTRVTCLIVDVSWTCIRRAIWAALAVFFTNLFRPGN